MIRIWSLALFVALAGLPVAAHASDAREQARASFMKGREAYAAGRFADALAAFEEANALQPHPLMLFNIAQVYEAMEDLASAVATYERYLASKPADADAVRTKIGELNGVLAGWPTVQVVTAPAGAEVRVGKAENPSRGRTPLTLRLPPTRQTLIFELAGHRTVERNVQFDPGTDTPLAVALPPILPVLSLRTTPAGAQVSIDGKPAGATPLEKGLIVGRHQVRITLDGFEPVEREVVLDATHTEQAPLPLAIELQKAIPRGDLVLVVSPAQAEIMVDGKLEGRAPLAGPLRLPEGLHQIEVRAPEAEPYSEMVTVVAGQTTTTEIDLSGGGPNLRSIGLITMIVGGAVVAGGAVTGALAMGADGDLSDCRDDPTCARTQREVDLADDVRSQALITDVLIGSGLAIAGAGVAMYLLGGDDGPTTAGGATFTVAPVEGGATAIGRFEF
ncbi:MAG: PEGA domain-containing protein [Myxococcales bacterium]|nr:PEGA domain-containing protein [Myxococcales bacterium]